MATTHFLDQLHRHYGRRRGHSGSSSGSESGRQSASGSSRPDPAVSRVRRALFGGGNREENIRFAQEQLARSRREASDRWDFDFENDRPILGRNYEWELAQPGGNRARNTPYDRPNVCDKPAAAIAAAAAEATAVCEAVNAVTTGAPTVTVAEVTTEVTAPAESGAPKSSSSQRQRQPSITEHFSLRKRSKSKVKTQERRRVSPSPPPPSQGAGQSDISSAPGSTASSAEQVVKPSDPQPVVSEN